MYNSNVFLIFFKAMYTESYNHVTLSIPNVPMGSTVYLSPALFFSLFFLQSFMMKILIKIYCKKSVSAYLLLYYGVVLNKHI